MLSDRLRTRLAELNREPLPTTRPVRARTRASAAVEALPAEPVEQIAVATGSLAADGCEIDTPLGKHWQIRKPLAALWRQSETVIPQAVARFAMVDEDPHRHAQWQQFVQRFPQDCVFLDLETCGFAGSMVFLVGLIHEDDCGMVLTQLLARNYAEEAAMLHTLWTTMLTRGTLLTFNGKSFDWPMVQDRSVLHRLEKEESLRAIKEVDPLHIDLLHHARRRWRRELPNCRLQTLEWYLCGRRRAGDIPGSEIPEVYHHYARTKDAREMTTVLHHNALDLITLLQLSLRLSTM